MSSQELQAKVQATKSFLNREIVLNRIQPENRTLDFREIGVRMDMIHEAERVGVRNLSDRASRKLTRMISELEQMTDARLN